MTNDEIEAEISNLNNCKNPFEADRVLIKIILQLKNDIDALKESFVRSAGSAVAAEREACAELCERQAQLQANTGADECCINEAHRCARDIRMRAKSCTNLTEEECLSLIHLANVQTLVSGVPLSTAETFINAQAGLQSLGWTDEQISNAVYEDLKSMIEDSSKE